MQPLETGGAAPALHLLYELRSDGDVVGRLDSVRCLQRAGGGGAPRVALYYRAHVRAGGFWSRYALDADEHLLFVGGTLQRYASKTEENGETSSAAGSAEEGALRLQLDDGRIRLRRFERGDYDATSEDAPDLFLAGGQDSAVLRVLDLERWQIEAVSYRRLPDESVAMPEGRRMARVLDFAFSKQKRSGRQWLVDDPTGDVLVREESVEGRERNEIVLMNWTMGTWDHAEQ